MKLRNLLRQAATGLLMWLLMAPAMAADNPVPRQGDWVAHDFRFHTGEVMPELRLHYTTLGDPSGEPVLVLHGTAGSGQSMLTPSFAGELFGPGQPLDARRYFIILPDAVGAGQSAKPSDGLRGKFPRYDYADMIEAPHRLLTEGLGVRHLRLVLGNSMGGMQTWMWGERYPQFMDALVPLASQPSAMAGRNWMMRRLLVESIRRDPEYDNGDYKMQPQSLKLMSVFFGVGTNGGTLAYQAEAPTTAKANALVDKMLAGPGPKDANDYVYQWDSSRDYDASPGLERIKARLLAVNSADDERNPPETGIMAREIKRVDGARLYVIPASEDTRGHGTTMLARFWKDQLAAFLRTVPQAGP